MPLKYNDGIDIGQTITVNVKKLLSLSHAPSKWVHLIVQSNPVLPVTGDLPEFQLVSRGQRSVSLGKLAAFESGLCDTILCLPQAPFPKSQGLSQTSIGNPPCDSSRLLPH